MKRYRTVAQLAEAMKRDEIPANVVSPGAVAAALGITRQSVHDRLKHNSLDAWCAEGVILIDARSLKAAVKKKRGIPGSQGKLNVTV